MWAVSDKDESTAIFRPGTEANNIKQKERLSEAGKFYGKVLGNYTGKRFLFWTFVITGLVVLAVADLKVNKS